MYLLYSSVQTCIEQHVCFPLLSKNDCSCIFIKISWNIWGLSEQTKQPTRWLLLVMNSQSPSYHTLFPITLSVFLLSITGLYHMGLRKARNVSCLLSPLACCLFGRKAIHVLRSPPSMLLSPWEIKNHRSHLKGHHANNSLFISTYTCTSLLYIQYVSLLAK